MSKQNRSPHVFITVNDSELSRRDSVAPTMTLPLQPCMGDEWRRKFLCQSWKRQVSDTKNCHLVVLAALRGSLSGVADAWGDCNRRLIHSSPASARTRVFLMNAKRNRLKKNAKEDNESPRILSPNSLKNRPTIKQTFKANYLLSVVLMPTVFDIYLLCVWESYREVKSKHTALFAVLQRWAKWREQNLQQKKNNPEELLVWFYARISTCLSPLGGSWFHVSVSVLLSRWWGDWSIVPTGTMTDENKSPAGSEDEKHVANTFFDWLTSTAPRSPLRITWNFALVREPNIVSQINSWLSSNEQIVFQTRERRRSVCSEAK